MGLSFIVCVCVIEGVCVVLFFVFVVGGEVCAGVVFVEQ